MSLGGRGGCRWVWVGSLHRVSSYPLPSPPTTHRMSPTPTPLPAHTTPPLPPVIQVDPSGFDYHQSPTTPTPFSPPPPVIQVPFEDATVADADASGGVLLSTPALPSDDPSSPSPSAIEAIIIRRRSIHGPAPTVLVPHGGPHAAFVTSFVTYYAFLAAAGYAVVLVNFRGSTGFGEAVVQALPGEWGGVGVR